MQQHPNWKKPKWDFPKWQDSDRDGVPDHHDCRPWDPTQQHIKPNISMQKRINKLPIYFTTGKGTFEELERGLTLYPITDKKVPAAIEKLKQRFYSLVRKRPGIIGELERKRPKKIIFSVKGIETEKLYGETIPEEAGKSIAVVRLTSPGRGHPYRREEREEAAGTIIHELEHVRQTRTWKDKPKLQQRMKKGKHSKRPEEILAYKAEEKAEKKRFEHQSYPYEFSPTYEKRKKAIAEHSKKYPREKRKYEGLQKKFFKGYRRMMNEE